MIWLTEDLAPDFKTIADFRKDNREGIKNIFKDFLNFCHKMDLLSLEIIAIDGTKLRAQNSINNIYKRNEIAKLQKRIQEKISEYLFELDIADEKEVEELKIKDIEVEGIVNKLKKLSKYKDKVKGIRAIFEGDKELNIYFATDKDSRFQSDQGKVKAGYNSQIATDSKNKLIVANDVTNESNDQKQMSPMIEKVKDVKEDLEIDVKTKAVMDNGYFSEKEIINNSTNEKIEVIVSNKKEPHKKKERTDLIPVEGFKIEAFKYNKVKDVYICPEGKELKRTHARPGIESSGRKVFEYQCYSCNGCKNRPFCTKNKRGRSIKVSVNKEYMDEYKESIKNDENKKIIKKRKEIVEHPFGTIKRSFGFTYFMQRGLEKVKAEFSFICFTYNLKRVLNMFSTEDIIEMIGSIKTAKLTTN